MENGTEYEEVDGSRGAVIFAILVFISAGLSCTSVGVLFSAKQEVKALVQDYKRERRRKKLYKQISYTDANGLEHVIHTERLFIEPGVYEALDVWCNRHDEAVASEVRKYPPA